MNTEKKPVFADFALGPELLKVVAQRRFVIPTPIQSKAIPPALEGQDIIGIAQTGTGKTLAFGIPLTQRLLRAPGLALALVPTRELALQVADALRPLLEPFRLYTATLIGGESMRPQLQQLRGRPRLIVATPGRLNDHLERRTVRLDDVRTLVLDEADRMLDMGFRPQIEAVLAKLPRERQTLLFSATMPPSITQIAARHMKLPTRVEIAPSGTAAEKVSQELFVVRRDAKNHLLRELLREYTGTVLVFVRTRRGAARVADHLRKNELPAAEIHSDRSLAQRKQALAGFKSGRTRILVATDIAARGIDVTGIELVVNYDLPDEPENYVHRIGRTGRAGQTGHAISLATPDQGQDIRRIEQILRATIPQSEHPEVPAAPFDRAPPRSASAPRRGGRGRGRFFRRR